eukprot:ctg_31.g4
MGEPAERSVCSEQDRVHNHIWWRWLCGAVFGAGAGENGQQSGRGGGGRVAPDSDRGSRRRKGATGVERVARCGHSASLPLRLGVVRQCRCGQRGGGEAGARSDAAKRGESGGHPVRDATVADRSARYHRDAGVGHRGGFHGRRLAVCALQGAGRGGPAQPSGRSGGAAAAVGDIRRGGSTVSAFSGHGALVALPAAGGRRLDAFSTGARGGRGTGAAAVRAAGAARATSTTVGG